MRRAPKCRFSLGVCQKVNSVGNEPVRSARANAIRFPPLLRCTSILPAVRDSSVWLPGTWSDGRIASEAAQRGRIFVVRDAQSAANAGERTVDPATIPITDQGARQAQYLVIANPDQFGY